MNINGNQNVFTLKEGPAILEWPYQLSEESFEDLQDWISLSLRQIKRTIEMRQSQIMTLPDPKKAP